MQHPNRNVCPRSNIARNKIRSKSDVFLYFRTTMASYVAYCISWTGLDWTGFAKRGLVKRGFVIRGFVKRGLVKRGFVKRGLVKRNKTISLY